MSLDAKADDRPISHVDELVQTLRSGERSGPLLLGLEHEKLIVPKAGALAVPYDAAPSHGGIGALLEGFGRFGWQPYREAPGLPVIAMQRGKATLSLEPGGQFELSGSPFATAREAHLENVRHAEELRQVADALGLRAVVLGYRPFDRLGEMPWMPKSRYGAMRRTLGTRGKLALDMMLMTATGQVSLDWTDEADCAHKVELAARLSPLLVALYANSPLVAGQPSGFLSYRSHVWSDVDAARCGYPSCLLDGSFSYRAYVEWALDAPLLFLRREGQYLTPALTFRQLLAQGYDGAPARMGDWVDHQSTLFPEVRLKRVLEIRAADCGSLGMTGALAALMRGLLYEPTARADAWGLVSSLSPTQVRALHEAAQRQGLRAAFGVGTLADLAKDVLGVARRGLERLDSADAPLLAPLEQVAQSGSSPAERVLAEVKRLEPAALLGEHLL